MNIFSFARKHNFSLELWDESYPGNEITRWALFRNGDDCEPAMFLDSSYPDEYLVRPIWAGLELKDQVINSDQLKAWISSHSDLQ